MALLWYRFDDGYEITENPAALRKSGETVPIPPTALRFLVYLFVHRGREHDVHDLQDNALPQHISEARVRGLVGEIYKAFGGIQNGRNIISNNGHGKYRFIAPVTAAQDASEPASVFNIPIVVPRNFVNEAVLADIVSAIQQFNIVALHGLRGVGKTVLAVAYAERHSPDYRAIWWIRAETEVGMRTDLFELGARLGWLSVDGNEARALSAVIERLNREGDGILLIFDNVLNADMLNPFLPRRGATRVLVTSNYHAWRGTAEPIEVSPWSKESGADYLIERTGDTDRKAAEDLSEALGGLPLAHEQAAAYIVHLEISVAEYARRFAAEPMRLLDTHKYAPDEYHDKWTVAKTFDLAIEAAAKQHPAAEPLIVHLALLAPEPIPLFLFKEGREQLGEPLSLLLTDDGLDEAIAALRSFALVGRESIIDERDPQISTDTIRLHRLVREIAAAKRSSEAQVSVRCALVEAIVTV